MSSTGQLWILTGDRGSGKTRCLQAVVAALQEILPVGSVQGLLSPAVHKDGQKNAIQLIDIASSEGKLLAERHSNGDLGPVTRHWSFHQATIDWGNRQLRRMPAADVFIIDELGPLELERKEGLQAALPHLDDPRYPLKLAVIRPALLDQARGRWSVDRIIDLEIYASFHQAAQEIIKSATLLIGKD